jgi:hypothetical protein
MKLVLKIAGGVILAVVLLTAGCAALISKGVSDATKKQTWTVRVKAPYGAHWSGAFGSSTVDGSGSKNVRVRDTLITAANAQKQDSGHWLLRLQLLNKDGKVIDSAGTTAQYGVASVSGGGS